MNDSNALSDLQVTYECKMDDNKLFLEIVNPQDDGTFFYACYLQNKKGENLEKQYYKRENIFEFILEEYGEYQCIYFIKNKQNQIIYKTTEKITFAEPRVIYAIGDEKFAGMLLKGQSDYKVEFIPGAKAVSWIKRKKLKDSKEAKAFLSVYDGWEGKLTENNLQRVIHYIKDRAPHVDIFYNKMYFDEEKNNVALDKNNKLRKLYQYLDEQQISSVNTHQLVTISVANEYLYEKENVFAKECIRQVKRKIRENEEKTRKSFIVNASIVGQQLRIAIEDNAGSEESMYCYYILKDGEVYYKHPWESKKSFTYELKESGIYVICGYVKARGIVSLKKSIPLEFFDEETKKEFEEFLGEEDAEEGEPLRFFHGEDPVANFSCLISKHGDSMNIKIDGFQTKCYQMSGGGQNVYLLSDREPRECSNGKYLFSGSAIINDRFIIGMDEIDGEISRGDIVCNAGCYTYINITDRDIYMGADLFGFNRLFYFENESLFLVSNRYHLLLLTMREAGIKIVPDLPKMLSHFAAVNLQPLLQGMTNRMDIAGVNQLEKHFDILIDHEGVQFVKNKYGKILEEREILTEPDYRRELCLAKEEILNNMKAVFQRKDYEHIIIDLSGGLDSRIIFGLLKEIEHNREKIKIRSNDVAGSRDLDVAMEINNIYNYKYDDMPRTFEGQNHMEMWNSLRSFYMGTYFSWMEPIWFEKCEGAIRLIGSCGEILARPYLTRNYLGTYLEDFKNAKDFFENYIKELSEFCACGYDYAIQAWVEIMSEEAEKQLTDTVFEDYERMYLQTRHGYHFDDLVGWSTIPYFGPLQSEKMFRLHHLTYNEFKSLKLQYDLTGVVDGELAEIPYELQRDNDQRKEIYNTLWIESKGGEVHLNDDRSKWQEANEIRESHTTRIRNKCISAPINREKEVMKSLRRFCKIEDGYFAKRVGMALFHYLKKHHDNRSIYYLNNKLMSILDQLNM